MLARISRNHAHHPLQASQFLTVNQVQRGYMCRLMWGRIVENSTPATNVKCKVTLKDILKLLVITELIRFPAAHLSTLHGALPPKRLRIHLPAMPIETCLTFLPASLD